MMIVERHEQGGPALGTGFGSYDDTPVKTLQGRRFEQRVVRPHRLADGAAPVAAPGRAA